MHALSIESAIEQPSCSCQRFIGSSDRRHISHCVRFVHPVRSRGVSGRSNLGDLLRAPSHSAVVGVAVRQLARPSLRCCARRRHPPACNEGGNQRQSETIRGNQRQSPCMARDSAFGYQWQSTAIKSNQWQSTATQSNQRSSEGHQHSSCTCVVTWRACHCLRGASASSRHVIITTVSYRMREAIRCHQDPSGAISC